MSLFTATALPFRLQTKNADHGLWIRSFTGEEAISKLFRFRLLAHANSHIPATKLLGQDVTFVLELRHHERSFLAKIGSVEELGLDEHRRLLYGLELVPRIWAATQTIRARVFEDLSPLEIVKEVFSESGTVVHMPEDTCLARPYCVQYFESDFDFVVRLLEEEGYMYEFGADGATPTFSIWRIPSTGSLGPLPFDGSSGGPGERIVSWKKTRVLTATEVSARDHFFQANAPVLGGTAGTEALGAEIPGWEPLSASWSASIGRYPGGWAHLFEEVGRNGGETPPSGYIDYGPKRAWHDLQQVAGWTSASEGAGNCHRLAPGRVFELAGHPAWAGKHLLVSVRHKGTQSLDHSTGEAGGFSYENQFTSVPCSGSTTMYLPPRATRKPVIYGCQTAMVVGPDGVGEIWTDKYGRVQVQFWWDECEHPRSCWIRVATPSAGSGWGIQNVPRIGQEVVVAFLDGDPDRPLIVGSVYNPLQMPPFDLPKNKTQSGIRTHSTPGGERGKANEIRFEDQKGSEKVYVHAQKDRYDVVEEDFHTTTNGDKLEWAGGDSSLTIGGDHMVSVKGKLGLRAKEIHLAAEKLVIEADAVSIRTSDGGGAFIHLKKGSGITIESKGDKVWLNCGGARAPQDGCFEEPAEPDDDPFKLTSA